MSEKIYTIDLSHLNSEFDWSKLSKDVKAVILKNTQGANYKDATFTSHANKVRTKGLVLGAYHFLNFTDSAQVQADNFLSRGIDFGAKNTLPPIVDIENQATSALDAHIYHNPKDSAKLVSDFLSILKAKTGRTPMIYTYNGFWTPTLNSPDFSAYPLWVANYTPNTPHPFGHWKDYTLWQFSQRGSHIHNNDGGDIDWSVLNPNADWGKLANL